MEGCPGNRTDRPRVQRAAADRRPGRAGRELQEDQHRGKPTAQEGCTHQPQRRTEDRGHPAHRLRGKTPEPQGRHPDH
eukprot:91021-Alexandrium_andersonii.AAC.1